MLKFLPRIQAIDDNGIFYAQQVFVGTRPENIACDYCRYRYTWTDATTRQQCSLKHKCNYYKSPWINLDVLHENEIENTFTPAPNSRKMYHLTRITRQVKLKGWPLYLQYVGCDDPQPQCNAMCFFHNQRLADKKTVAQCAHTHGCSRSGSFFDLLVPTNADIYDQFFHELNSMNP